MIFIFFYLYTIVFISLFNIVHGKQYLTGMYGSMKDIDISTISKQEYCDNYHFENKIYGISPYNTIEMDFVTNVSINSYNQANEIYQQSIEILKENNASDQELAVLSPSFSGCAWLQVSHVERLGYGHTFAGLSYYLRVALENNLTYFGTFYTADMGNCNLNETAPYFGFHSVFRWARYPPENSTVIEISPDEKRCTSLSIKEAVDKYLLSNNRSYFSCDDGNVLFLCRNEMLFYLDKLAHNVDQVQKLSTSVFQPAFSKYSPNYRTESVKIAKDKQEFVMTVHIRRGDIVQRGAKLNLERIVSVTIYFDIVEQLLSARQKAIDHLKLLGETRMIEVASKPVKVFALCEGAPNNHTLIELYIPTHYLFEVDLYEEESQLLRNIEVVPEKSMLQAFTTLCDADILVTSPSAFPYLAAALCDPKLIVAIPLNGGLSYDHMKNVVHVIPLNGSLSYTGSRAHIEGLQEAWVHFFRNFV